MSLILEVNETKGVTINRTFLSKLPPFGHYQKTFKSVLVWQEYLVTFLDHPAGSYRDSSLRRCFSTDRYLSALIARIVYRVNPKRELGQPQMYLVRGSYALIKVRSQDD